MIRNNLRDIRMAEFKMSQTDFCKLLNQGLGETISTTQYNNWERSYSFPKLEMAIIIAKILNKHVNDIWYAE